MPRRTEAVWLRARALSSRPKLAPASPSRLMMPVHMWAVVWLIAAELHSHHPGHFRPYPFFYELCEFRELGQDRARGGETIITKLA